MISVCVPAFNYAAFLPVALESCLSQDADFELVVVDNASTDGTAALRERFEGDGRVRWFRNESTLPVQASWNRAVSLATRPFVKLLPADDALKPGSVRRLEAMIAARPDAHLHGHLADVVDRDGRVLRRQRPAVTAGPVVVSGATAIRGKLRQEVRFREPACNAFSRAAWEAVGGWSDRYRAVFDVHFNARVAARYPAAMWTDSLACLRRHGRSDGATMPAAVFLDELRALQGELLEWLGADVTPDDRAAADGWLLYRAAELAAQRARRDPAGSARFLAANLRGATRPRALYYAARLLRNKVMHGEPQQAFRPAAR